MDAMDLAREALDLAKDVERRVDAHEDICALRYKQLETGIVAVKDVKDEIGDVKKILGWATRSSGTSMSGTGTTSRKRNTLASR